MAVIDRRRFLSYGAGVLIPVGVGVAWFDPFRSRSLAAAGTLPGEGIPRFRDALTLLPAMPRTARITSGGRAVDVYEVAQRQLTQQVLPTGMPRTTVWGYGSVNHPGSFRWPGNTFEARVHTPVRVKWINDLRNPSTGRFLPPLLPVDPTLHWANPPGGTAGRDGMPMFDTTPGPYTGPVPMVVHLHGSERSPQESDGYPEAWFLPDAADIPAGFARTGTFYDPFRQSSPLGNRWSRGTAVFEYPNEQAAATLWYHDHTLGMTRTNIHSGLAGLYFLRGSEQLAYPEIPLIIQDRSFNADGSLFYPDSRAFFDGFTGPYVPDSDIPPIWNAEFFGETIVVNGRTWPFHQVERRRYRLRLLNACGSRFLILRNDGGLPFWQIGADGGFLPSPVRLDQLLLGPAERADVIVDFSQVPAGTTVTLTNVGPDEPFGGGEPGVDFPPANPDTTGQVLQFRVVARVGSDDSAPPEGLRFATPAAATSAATTRRVSLNELDSAVLPDVGPLVGLLGTVNADHSGNPLRWHDAATEMPRVGSSEVWEIHNFTEDAHPIHIHVTQFRVLSRQSMETGTARGPDPGESGRKDTVIAYPGEVTRVQAPFAQRGLFVWHCHIVEHEDNEMMRPLRVV
jgi:FtsP/CotA-like multicopper oxidase with cupredoxin domain